ncbi:MAG: DUF29 domain-containing protein [Candidatus Magnetoovum sp. WYHC-5]|nr:DUF29 domain-containing protein [Candidatus Magnetoovum sp. WYHC-5]
MQTKKSLYDSDFYQWALYNAELLKQGKFTEIDIDNIAEELEDMGKNNKRELESRLMVLIMHLLKWQYQPIRRSESWRATINTQRVEIERLLKNSPSLKHNIETVIDEAFKDAAISFEDETGIDKKHLLQTCPYTFEQLRDRSFRPD